MIPEPASKTKILCTLGPATREVEVLVRMITAGMDVVRLNFSHGTHEDHRLLLASVRKAIRQTGRHIGILQDLQGPKIRIGTLAAPVVTLVPGGTLVITTEPVAGDAMRVSTTYAGLPSDVRPGDRILLDDGKLQLKVRTVHGNEVETEVVIGGALMPHKGINLPGVNVSSPSCTPKDLEDLAFGLDEGVDYVALSFVRSAGDIGGLRRAIARHRNGQGVQVIAKIEKPEAIRAIHDIIHAADGIMIARGDLGVEMPPEEVPILQKRIVALCNAAGKPVIIATQMLESMIENPRPTRAETNDVANAVLDGGDAVMLSGETSVGHYPLEAVTMMNRIILRAEAEQGLPGRRPSPLETTVSNRHEALGQAACMLAQQMHAAAIVAVTRSGQTARVLSRYRPSPKIIAVTADARTLQMLGLAWGVRGLVIPDLDDDSDKALHRIQERLAAGGWVRPGEYVVLLGGQPFLARGSTNFIKVEKIG
jgi:pyruvate kinase